MLYTRVLDLRLVKCAVNFDAPDTYHFYCGDIAGNPGSLLTFFPFPDATAGRAGTGMAGTTAFAIPEVDFELWMRDRSRADPTRNRNRPKVDLAPDINRPND